MTTLQWVITVFSVWSLLCALVSLWLYYCGSTKQ